MNSPPPSTEQVESHPTFFHLNCLQPNRWNWQQPRASLPFWVSSQPATVADWGQAKRRGQCMGSVGRTHPCLGSACFFPFLLPLSSISPHSISFLLPYFSLFLSFLIFLCLCSGIVIWPQCSSEIKNLLPFSKNKVTLSPWSLKTPTVAHTHSRSYMINPFKRHSSENHQSLHEFPSSQNPP